MAVKHMVSICCLLMSGAVLAAPPVRPGGGIWRAPPTQSDVDAALVVANRAKVDVAEHVQASGTWPNSNAEAGYDGEKVGSATISIRTRGIVVIDFGVGAIELIPFANPQTYMVEWVCVGHSLSSGVLREPCVASPILLGGISR